MSTAAKCVVLDTWAGRRYYAVEVVGDLPRIELFARQKTNGWDVWGNESNESNGI